MENHLIQRVQLEGDVWYFVINPWLSWYKCYISSARLAELALTYSSYIATDLGLNDNLELCRFVLSISFVSVCETGLTALDVKMRVLHRVQQFVITNYNYL